MVIAGPAEHVLVHWRRMRSHESEDHIVALTPEEVVLRHEAAHDAIPALPQSE
jgi:hypothetical protein